VTRLPFLRVGYPEANDDFVVATGPLPAIGIFDKQDLTDNDIFIDPLSFALVSSDTNCGGAVVESGPDVHYIGPESPTGPCVFEDTFSYAVCSAEIPTGCDVATVTVAINHPPDAVPDLEIGTTPEDTPIDVTDAELLANDADPDGDPLTVISVQSGLNGHVERQDGVITFTPTPDFNGEGSFEYTISDGGGGTDSAAVTVTVEPVNDAPVLDSGKSPALGDVPEDAPSPVGYAGTPVSGLVQIGGALDNVSDPDGPSLGVAVIGSDRSNGDWFYSIDNGGTWSNLGTPSENQARTLDGSALLYFRPDANFVGQADVSFRAWDQSSGINDNTANILATGGFTAYSSGSDSATVTVSAVNDPPTSTNDSVTTLEKTPVVLFAGDFGDYFDVEGTPLASVKITGLPGDGSLEWDSNGIGSWQPVSENHVITATDISEGRLRFVPDGFENGSPYATIGFRVSEDETGTVLSTQAYTLTVNVTPVNDAPAGTDNDTAGMAEDLVYIFAVADFGFTDPFDTPPNGFLEVIITTLPDSGSGALKLSGAAVAANDAIPVAQIPLLTFVPVLNVNGEDLGQFLFQVRDDGGSLDGGVDTDPSANFLNFDIVPVNDEPKLTATALDPSFIEGGSDVDLFTAVSASAVEDGSQLLTRLDLVVSSLSDGSSEILTIDGSSINLVNGAGVTSANGMNYSVIVSSGTATVVLTDSGGLSAATMSALIDGMAYRNDSVNPTVGLRSVTVTRLEDSGPFPGNSASFFFSSSVTVISVNNAPVISNLDGETLYFSAGSGTMPLDQSTDAVVSDPDSPDFSGGVLTVTISSNYNDQPTDSLYIQSGGGVSLAGSSLKSGPTTIANFSVVGDTLTVIFNSEATPALATEVVRNVTFSNSNGTSLGAPRTVTFEITDGDGGTSSPASVTVVDAGS
jgi:hypothetical protein